MCTMLKVLTSRLTQTNTHTHQQAHTTKRKYCAKVCNPIYLKYGISSTLQNINIQGRQNSTLYVHQEFRKYTKKIIISWGQGNSYRFELIYILPSL